MFGTSSLCLCSKSCCFFSCFLFLAIHQHYLLSLLLETPQLEALHEGKAFAIPYFPFRNLFIEVFVGFLVLFFAELTLNKPLLGLEHLWVLWS